MKVVHYKDVTGKVFDQGPAKGVTGRVVMGKSDGANNFCMRVFELAPSGHTPMHTHDWEHEIFVHSGNGEAFCDGQWKPINPGTGVFIPSNEQHQIKNIGESSLIFVCLIPSGIQEL